MRSGRYILAAALLLLALAVPQALAAGYSSTAKRPSYDAAGLQLVGQGAYRTAAARPQLRVTVCLRQRVSGRFFDVRCETGTASGSRVVKAVVSVPGCVKGVWRTSASGEALNRKGAWVHQSSAVSRPFRC